MAAGIRQERGEGAGRVDMLSRCLRALLGLAPDRDLVDEFAKHVLDADDPEEG